jgi:undecaprenyl-diphosphatase
MEFWEIVLYSIVQGITEFIPISSSAHLIILENLLNWPVSGRTMAISAHLGTLIAVIIFLKKDIMKILNSFYQLRNTNLDKNIILIRNLIAITIPILLIGLIVFKNLDKQLLSLSVIGWSSIIGGAILYISDKYRNGERDIYSLSILDSFFIGAFQIFALIPGSSRAGTVITAARMLKLTRIESTKLGLYSGIPTITGAVILELIWLLSNKVDNQEYLYILIVCTLSFIFAYLTIIFLIKWLKNYTFFPFIIYRISIGIIILFLISN